MIFQRRLRSACWGTTPLAYLAIWEPSTTPGSAFSSNDVTASATEAGLGSKQLDRLSHFLRRGSNPQSSPLAYFFPWFHRHALVGSSRMLLCIPAVLRTIHRMNVCALLLPSADPHTRFRAERS